MAKAAPSHGILTRVGGFIKKPKSSGRNKVSTLGNAAKINVNDRWINPYTCKCRNLIKNIWKLFKHSSN